MKKITFFILTLFFISISASAANYENLYIVGSATNSAFKWDNGGAPELENAGSGVFTWKGVLRSKDSGDGGQARFKFLVTGKGWSPCFTCQYTTKGHTVIVSGQETSIYEFDGKGEDNAFQVSSSGTYTIRIDLGTMKMVCTKISDDTDTDLDHFTKEAFLASNGETLKYRKLVPIAKESGVKYPLVIVLHGAGERGSDNASQLTHGGELFAKKANREAYPAYVLFPQCPSNYFWPFNSQPASYTATTFPVNYPVSSAIQEVKELIDSYLAMEDVDKERVYISGLSMGGMGTFDITCRFPEIFAAAVPLCGGINIERLDSGVKDIYWRLFHGGSDGTVTVENSRTANTKLKAIGADVEYIEYPGVGHDVWNNVFAREDYLPWMFSKTKRQPSGVETASKEETNVYYDNGKLYVKMESAGSFKINLYAISGILLHTITDVNTDQDLKEYTLPFLNKGIYLVEIQMDKNNYSFKISI